MVVCVRTPNIAVAGSVGECTHIKRCSRESLHAHEVMMSYADIPGDCCGISWLGGPCFRQVQMSRFKAYSLPTDDCRAVHVDPGAAAFKHGSPSIYI